MELADLPRFRANFTRGRKSMLRVNKFLKNLGRQSIIIKEQFLKRVLGITFSLLDIVSYEEVRTLSLLHGITLRRA